MELEKSHFWNIRHKIFSKFDEWILCDIIWLNSTKTEEMAIKLGNMVSWNIVLDWFCWLGSNAIWFALAWKKVITCDINWERLKMAQNNAKIYWVQDKITFIHWNVLNYIWKLEYDTAYFDPPWSTNWVHYLDKWKFKFSDYWVNGLDLIILAKQKTDNIIFALPINFDFSELDSFLWSFIITKEMLEWQLFLFYLFLSKKNNFSNYKDTIIFWEI